MEFNYAVARISQINEIMEIYGSAQKFMESIGNPQWGKGFPDDHDIREGIFGGVLYSVTTGGAIAAVFSVLNYDENYVKIDGKWLTSGNYLAVHRVAVAEKFRHTGVAKHILEEIAPQLARKRGRMSLRIDTHERNVPMLNLLEKLNFTRCGIINVARDDTSRIAFEKLI